MAVSYSTPGVYIRQEDRGVRPIRGVGTAVAAFVGFTADAPDAPGKEEFDEKDPEALKPRMVTSWGAYQRLYGGLTPGALLPYAVRGFFGNGGGSAYIVRVASGGATPETPTREVPSSTDDSLSVLRVRPLDPQAQVRVEVEHVPQEGSDAAPGDEPSGGGGPAGRAGFTVRVQRAGQEPEEFTDLSPGPGPRNAATVINQRSDLIRVESVAPSGTSAADLLPAEGTYELERSAEQVPATVGSSAFEGSEADRTGVRGLTIADDVTMIAIPDLATAATTGDGEIDHDMWQAVQNAAVSYCEKKRSCLTILDTPPDLSPNEVRAWREETGINSEYATLYYPWLRVRDGADGNGGGTRSVPPSGHVAGIWARTDSIRGVHKAPANEGVRGLLDLEEEVTGPEQGHLNDLGVNCIRAFGTRGIRVWGARTLSTDVNWQYVNVRRLFTYVEQSVQRGIQWVVFEPNGRELWQRVKRSLAAFLLPLWEAGALVGATPDQAFFVKCDAENNPERERNLGRLHVDVGLAASRPAEFVVIHISQAQQDVQAAG